MIYSKFRSDHQDTDKNVYIYGLRFDKRDLMAIKVKTKILKESVR